MAVLIYDTPKSRRIFSTRDNLVSISSPEYSRNASTTLPLAPVLSKVTGTVTKGATEWIRTVDLFGINLPRIKEKDLDHIERTLYTCHTWFTGRDHS
jgi:hypothetical protein